MTAMYDTVIVGAGSAGCVLANRLSADPGRRVLLLEAGPPDNHPWVRIPAGFARLGRGSPYNWGFLTEPEPGLNGRRIPWPRGRGLGGSSSINAMVYLRGHAGDFDAWEAEGAAGWGWRDVLPYFRRGERFEGGADVSHGADGELAVTSPVLRHPASEAFLAGAGEYGLAIREDLNDGQADGAGFLHFTIDGGVRASSARAFLRPARGRPNLRVVTGATARSLILEGRLCRGVRYETAAGSQEVSAREVVLCAGAIGSPQLLMLSGIGPGDHLRQMGLEVAFDAPRVGENLQDHIYVTCGFRVAPRASMNARLRGAGLVREAMTYLAGRRGALALGASQVSAFLRSRPGLERPDLQLNFTPLSYSVSDGGEVTVDAEPGVTTALAHVRPRSRGWLRLASPDPAAAPRLQANYLAHEADARAVLAGLRAMGEIWRTPALAALSPCALTPGPDDSDETLMAFVRATAGSLFHPVGTCRMGKDPLAVVDSRLRVRGLAGLRVADASIMPLIVSAPTNAASIMIGEKAADLVIEDLARQASSP